MPSQARLEAFIARVVEGKHVEAIEEFYTENASMQENLDPPRVGRAGLMERERKVLAGAKQVISTCVRPVFVNGDHVVINWIFEFTGHDGKSTRLDELAHQRWDGDRIVEERFYYNPAQLRG
jgi:hypothetical protein